MRKIFIILFAIILSSCAAKYEFSLNDTLSIFMINNDNESLFCIPVQYLGDYQISRFSFTGGKITIGGYEILLNNDDINIYIYLNEDAPEDGGSIEGFNQIYSKEKGTEKFSDMSKTITSCPENINDDHYHHYYIFIEKYLTKNDLKNITSEYKKGNVISRYIINYDIVIDNEEQNGSGMLDDFKIHDGVVIDPKFYPPNLNFFKVKYL